MTNLVIVETRRSKGVHKADITKLSAEQVKLVLAEFNSNSYVALKNYRTNCFELRFERMKEKGIANYSLKTSLTEEDFKALGFVKSEKGNYHLTQKGCSINKFDIEVKEPVKKISSKKEKAEKKEAATKAPLPTKSPAKAPLPAKAKVEEKAAAVDAEADDEDDDE